MKPVSSVLLMVGLLLLVDAVTTLVWQEPVSAVYAKLQQGRLQSRSGHARGQPSRPRSDRKVLSHLPGLDRKLAYAARVLDRRTDDGQPLGRISLPSIGVQRGGGGGHRHGRRCAAAPATTPARRCRAQRGTVAIAGHRTTYGAWFRRLDQLNAGDKISLTMPYGRFTLRGRAARRSCSPTDIWVTHRVGYDRLVLSACHPLYSAAKRIVVFARLVATKPRSERLALSVI